MVLEIQILEGIIEYLNEKCPSFVQIMTGGLSAKNSISAEIATGYSRSEYLGGGMLQRMPVLILIKHQKHQTAMETAFRLAHAVRKARKINDSFISMGTSPEFVQKSGADYIYSLIFNVDYMVK